MVSEVVLGQSCTKWGPSFGSQANRQYNKLSTPKVLPCFSLSHTNILASYKVCLRFSYHFRAILTITCGVKLAKSDLSIFECARIVRDWGKATALPQPTLILRDLL